MFFHMLYILCSHVVLGSVFSFSLMLFLVINYVHTKVRLKDVF